MTTTVPHTDPILDKVRKLLAKAEDDACTPAEAEAFTAKATELIAKYGIDRAMLAATDTNSDRPGDRIIPVDAPYARDKVDLLVNVSLALRCKNVIRTRHVAGRKQLDVHLFGYASDLDRTELLYTSLLVQAAHALAAAEVPYWANTAAWRRSWMAGFTSAIYSRLKAAEARAERNAHTATTQTPSSGPSVALVLADRSAVIAKSVADAYPRLKTTKPRQLSGSGEDAGWSAGQRANLGGTGLGRSARAEVGA